MHLSDEEKISILEEFRDKKIQRDIEELSSYSKKMSLAEYLDFLKFFWDSKPRQKIPSRFITYKNVIF